MKKDECIYDIVAMRGRDKDNPSDITAGNQNLEQRLEINSKGICNTITTVQKDNYVLVRQATKEGNIPCKIGGVANLSFPDSKTRRGRVIENGEICPTLTTESIPNVIEEWVWEIDGVKYQIRIRKLSPRECWDLMDFNKGAYDKASKVNSKTQLYKEAGNSIVVNCLVAILGQMIEGREDTYKNI